ncbi:hypothetical protein BGZ88_003403 [Linnemannia elongata]|nr:hypothetical protein BGZ88_003403 [Linnemannia elongata]
MVEPLCRRSVARRTVGVLEERTCIADSICSLIFPDPDPVKPLYDIPIFILIGTHLTSVLRYHHAFVREDQAFEPRFVLAAVDLAKTQVHAQLAENKRQGEERDLPPSVEHPPVDDNFPTYPQKNKRASFNVPSPFQRSKPRPTSKRSPMSDSYNVQAPSNVASITPVPTVHPVP